jgi:hypothetical protein
VRAIEMVGSAGEGEGPPQALGVLQTAICVYAGRL